MVNDFLPLVLSSSSLTATAVSSSEIDLVWQSGVGSITSYQVERNVSYSNIGWSAIGTIGLTHYTDANLSPGTSYYYRVCAVTGAGSSAYLTATATTLPALPAASTRMTPPLAISAAAVFCQAIGQPVTGTGTAQYHILDNNGLNDMAYWQPRWTVVYNGQAQVEVVDATGAIASYINLAWYQGPESTSTQSAGTAMSQASAIQQANVALQASGQTELPATVPAAVETQDSGSALFNTHYWQLSWQRLYQEYLYRDQYVNALLQAETGQIKILNFIYPSPPLPTAVVSVNQAHATSAAQSMLANAGGQYAAADAPQLEIVQPNSFWQDGNVFPQPGTASRLAYICRFAVDTLGGTGLEVWVDAQTGNVIGGIGSGVIAVKCPNGLR